MPSYTSYMRQMAVMDADDDNIEAWITVKGNHIPIMKGQSKEDAVKSFIEGKKKNLVENHNSLVEAINLEEKGYFKKDPKKRDSITQSAIEMGKEEKNLEELMEFGVKEGNAAKPESKKEEKPTAKPANKQTFYKNVSGREVGTPKGRTIIENELLTEKEMAKYGADPKSEKFKSMELGKKDHHFFFGARFENEKKEEKPKKSTMLSSFGKHYDNLYEGKTEYNRELVKEFDDKMANDPEFKKQVQAFVRERGDVLSSDREVQAYMMARQEQSKPEKKEEGTPVEVSIEESEKAVSNFFEEQQKKRHELNEKKYKQEAGQSVNIQSGQSISNFFDNMNQGLGQFVEMTGYEPQTTFWSDFSIAEAVGGEKAIRDTYNRAFKEWKDNKEYVTELVMMLNWKIWHHHAKGNEKMARLYDELWGKADEWCMKNLKGEDLKYFLRTTD